MFILQIQFFMFKELKSVKVKIFPHKFSKQKFNSISHLIIHQRYLQFFKLHKRLIKFQHDN